MLIRNLKLTNYRTYDKLDISFEKGLNFILGRNASGKTNIVEAIYFLSIGHSFRTDDDSQLIKDQNEFAVVEGQFDIGDNVKKIKTVITSKNKSITCNSYKLERLSELAKMFNVIVFKPDDVLLFNDSPSLRRKFMDTSISKMDYSYLKSLSEYNRLLKERNEILKLEKIDDIYLDTITTQMINVSRQIVLKRDSFINKLNELISKVIKELKGCNDSVVLKYYPYQKPDDDFINKAQNTYKDALENDLRHKSTSVGLHRENFVASLNGRDIAIFGSQGEKRLVALSLTLCLYFLVEEKEKKPIVILDDVLSELDKNHQTRLINFVSKMEQVFITATDYNDKNINSYYVSNHRITRR